MKKESGFSFVAVIVILAVIGLAGFIGWRVYEINQKSSTSSSNNQSATSATAQPQDGTQPSQSAASTKTFKSSYLNFSSDYLADWTLVDDGMAPDNSHQYLSVTAPGTIESELPHSGYKYIEKGAIIGVSAYTLRDDGSYAFDNYYNRAIKDYVASSTFRLSDGTEATRFKYAIEGPEQLYTVFVKNNIKYVITLRAEGDITTSSYIQAYDNLINSIR